MKSGRVNNRLLCELLAHKDFIRLLADIEIYVDRVASMQVQNLNAYVDVVRQEIIDRYRPGEDDPTSASCAPPIWTRTSISVSLSAKI